MCIFFAHKFDMNFQEFLKSEESKKPHYLLIGNPVSHSVSPLMHNTALNHYQLNAKYVAVKVEEEDISSLSSHFNRDEFLGANITIPHKHTFLDIVDSLSPEVSIIGAMNTIVKKESKLVGYNTDAYGFSLPILELEEEIEMDRAIVFGSGGATKAIIVALNDLGFEEVIMVSRKPHLVNSYPNQVVVSYDVWTDYADESSLLVNATPLGMTPNIDTSPVKDAEMFFLEGKTCYDIVYNPLHTKFLDQATKASATTIGGLEMLIHQGAKAFKLWTGKEFPIGLIKMKLDHVFTN